MVKDSVFSFGDQEHGKDVYSQGSIQHNRRSLSQHDKARKRNKTYSIKRNK